MTEYRLSVTKKDLEEFRLWYDVAKEFYAERGIEIGSETAIEKVNKKLELINAPEAVPQRSITINTESTPVDVEDIDTAIKMMCVTAYMMQLTHTDMKDFKEMQDLASYFKFDTDTIIIEPNPNADERFQGFFNVYRRYGESPE